MRNCIKTLHIDTSSLPAAQPVFQKIYPILKKRIENRCGTVCVCDSTDAAFVLRFVLDPNVPAEGFRMTDCADGIQISGADFLALLYGAGHFLRKSNYTPDGMIPATWRGQSVPQNEKRVIQFCQHFFNWYQCCTEDELREHIEDLALWGLNGVSTVFSCLNLTGWDDPNLPNMVKIVRCLMKTAKDLTLKTGIEFSNVDFMNHRAELRADYKYLLSKAGNLICPSAEGGYEYIEELFSKILSLIDDIGLDFIVYIAYDEGGCSCDKCWPWAGKGYYDMTRRLTRFAKKRYPHLEFWLFTWYVGHGDDHKDEWPSLYNRLQEDAAKGDNWADYLLLETRDYYEQVYYPTWHGQPTPYTKMLTFPDVSMTGLTPWGAFGTVCTPALMERWEKPFENHCNGGYLYTEGIWDDINKAVMLEIYWDRSYPTNETLKDYCRYEFPGLAEDDFVRLVKLIEVSQEATNRINASPCDLSDCQEAWELAEKMNNAASPALQQYWRWRIVYIRAYLDLVRYTNCAEAGWPMRKKKTGWFRFWRRFLEHDQRSQDYLLELIHLYKAQEYEDQSKYAYHYYLRPPMTRGADLSEEVELNTGMI